MSLSKIKTTVLLASAALLCTSPLAAALKTKSNTTRVKARTAAPAGLKASSSSASSRVSPRSISPKSTKTDSVSLHNGRKSKVRAVALAKPKFHGQQAIEEARTLEIQQALIREHYLSGEASGEWDQATREALTRFQGDNHWQTKILPDSRALIKLGLGPSQHGLLNPESAAVAIPYQPGTSTYGGSN
jgi:Putative peptidoglycan binding domain